MTSLSHCQYSYRIISALWEFNSEKNEWEGVAMVGIFYSGPTPALQDTTAIPILPRYLYRKV